MHSVRLNSSGYTVNTSWNAGFSGRLPGSWVQWAWADDTSGLNVASRKRDKMVLLENSFVGEGMNNKVLKNPMAICPQRGDVMACPITGGMPKTGQFGRYVQVQTNGFGSLIPMEVDTPRWHAVAVIIGDSTRFPILDWPFALNYFPVQIL